MKGVIQKIMEDRNYGFILGEDRVEYFFHRDDFNGFFSDLIIDMNIKKRIEVTFMIVPSAKGPRAHEVTRTDDGRG